MMIGSEQDVWLRGMMVGSGECWWAQRYDVGLKGMMVVSGE